MARFDYLAPYATFTTVQEMDEVVEQHIHKHYYNLTPSDKAILYKMASHALDYPGACHLKAQTIAAALSISVRTVFRTLKRLEEFQIIQRIQTKKMNGIKGANIFSILPYHDTSILAHQEEAETPSESKAEIETIKQEPSLSSNPKHQYGKHTYPMLNTSIRNRIFHYLASTTGNTSETKRFADVVYKQLKPLLEWEIYQSRKQQLEDISFTAFKETIQQTKKQFIRNPFGYMYKKLDRKLNRFIVDVMEFYLEAARRSDA